MKTFSFFPQYSWMHSSETLSVMWIMYVSRAACKPRQADIWKVEQKNPCSLSASLSWAIQECQCIASFYDGPPTSTDRQVFRDIWWVHQTRSCPMLSARLFFWASCSLDMCPLLRFTRPPPFLARSCRLSFAFWPGRLPKPFFLGHRLYTG